MNVKLARNLLANCRARSLLLVIRINNLLPQIHRVWFHLISVPVHSLTVSCSIKNCCIAYFLMLGLQILSEILTLRQFHTVVWVMVPYLYLPYRIWQLYEGLSLLSPENELMWVRNLLLVEIVLWTLNYALDVSQLPRLLRWEIDSQRN